MIVIDEAETEAQMDWSIDTLSIVGSLQSSRSLSIRTCMPSDLIFFFLLTNVLGVHNHLHTQKFWMSYNYKQKHLKLLGSGFLLQYTTPKQHKVSNLSQSVLSLRNYLKKTA